MKKKKITRKKYATGTAVKNYMQDPATELAKNQINMTKAQQQVGSDDLTNFLSLLGNMGMQFGAGMAGDDNLTKAVAGTAPLLGNMQFALGGNVGGGKDGKGAPVIINTNEQMKMFGGMIQKMFAMGGEVTGEEQLDDNNIPVEVEGGEMAETPDGQLLDFEGGPSHEEGGIPIDLPEGTEVFSDRIEIHGETPAERKRKREKKEEEIHKLLEKSPGDKVLLNTLKRLQESNAQEEAYDQDIQEQVAQSQEGEQEFAYGGRVRKKYPNGTNSEGIKRPRDLDLNLPNMTPGDITGMLGTLYSTFAPMQNTLEQRAGDTPNINAFENYGENALGAMDNAMSMLDGQQEKALQDLELSKNTSMRSNRNTARGVNTMRSLDLGTDQATNQATGDIYSKFAEQAMNLLTNRAGMLNQQDQMRMTGEQARDVADREDRGSFYTQLGADKAAKGAGIQTLGKLLNQNKMNTVTESALGNLSKYGLFFNNRGIVVDSTGVPTSDADKERFAKNQGYSNFDSWLKDNQNRI